MDRLKIALVQLDTTVGDLVGNRLKIEQAHAEAAEKGADILVCSELTITGYPAEDLIFREEFQQQSMQAVLDIAELTKGGAPAIAVGGIWFEDEHVYNTAFLLDGGEVHSLVHKFTLPNYGVFDEQRVFTPGKMPEPIEWRGQKIGLLVCRDMWEEDIGKQMATKGAELTLALNASPYDVPKWKERLKVAEKLTSTTSAPLVYINQVGGQDELVFDGRSFVMGADGALNVELPRFEEAVQVTEWQKGSNGWQCDTAVARPSLDEAEEIYRALVCGVRAYVEKNGFPGTLIGLSGGIDSALTAAIAVDALGAENVKTIMLPYNYTSQESIEDAQACAEMLEVEHQTIPIKPAIEAFDGMLAEVFAGRPEDVTEENLQSRIRGVTLMAISNKFGYMLLTTGNKSEMAMGYATLYGDMSGGYNPLKDVYKTQVVALANWRNANRPDSLLGPDGMVMPERIITKPPSAELRPDQKDEDSLPPYNVLDPILKQFIEDEKAVEDIVGQMGRQVTREVVEQVARLLYISEYKRRQAPPGVKISRLSFGRDRRYPLTNRYRSGA